MKDGSHAMREIERARPPTDEGSDERGTRRAKGPPGFPNGPFRLRVAAAGAAPAAALVYFTEPASRPRTK